MEQGEQKNRMLKRSRKHDQKRVAGFAASETRDNQTGKRRGRLKDGGVLEAKHRKPKRPKEAKEM